MTVRTVQVIGLSTEGKGPTGRAGAGGGGATGEAVGEGRTCGEVPGSVMELPAGWRPDDVAKVQRQLRAAAYAVGVGSDVGVLIRRLDKDGSKELEYEEFRVAVRTSP